MTFAEKIKKERMKLQMTQTEFAAYIGISFRSVQNYEAGKNHPRTRDAYQKIAEALNLSTDYLLTENEAFIMDIGNEFGSRGRKGAQKLLEQINYTYTNGEMDEDDLEILTQGIQELYWKVKRANREKYDPYKNKRNAASDGSDDAQE